MAKVRKHTRRVRQTRYYAPDAGRFVRAWADATSEMVRGTSRVFSDLIVDFTDAVWGRADDEDDDEDEDEVETTREGTTVRVRHRGRTIGHSLDSAVRDSARVFSRSMDRFADHYEEGDEAETSAPVVTTKTTVDKV